MTPAQRMLLNTAASYCRTVCIVGVTLFSSRWVLAALGKTDFGLFSVVGSLLYFVVFLNGILAGSAGRYYAYAIGQGDAKEVNNWFNAALSIHLLLAFCLTAAGWLLGEYLIRQYLIIPPARLDSCVLVFRISLASAFVGILAAPFTAMFTAKQYIVEVAFWGVVQALLWLVLAWSLLHTQRGDRLLIYATGMATIACVIYMVQILRALLLFAECRIHYKVFFSKKYLSNIFTFAFWNGIGSSGAILRDQGTAIVLNLYHGPQLNAAYGIANQVSAGANQLATALTGAFYPEITAREGRGERASMLNLSLRTCKYATLLALLVVVPLFVEMDYVLQLWLREPPQYAAQLCRLILIAFVIDRLTTGFMLAVNAHGRIAAYQATLGISLMLTLPLVWLFLHLGFHPTSVGCAFIITMCVCSLGRVYWVKKMFALPMTQWMLTVAIPCLGAGVMSFLSALLINNILSSSFIRFVLVCSIVFFTTTVFSYYFIASNVEKVFIQKTMLHLKNR